MTPADFDGSGICHENSSSTVHTRGNILTDVFRIVLNFNSTNR